MNTAVNEFDRARGKVADDLKTMISDSEDLLKAAATASGAGFTAACTKFEDKLRMAKLALADASQPVIDRTRKTAAVADGYVHDHAWGAVGVAIAAGVLIGLLAARR